jgi:hypothetical protein
MTKRSEAQPPVHLRGYLDGRPVDYTALLSAVRDGGITDLDRIEVALDRRAYLSPIGVSVPEELVGYPPVSSKRLRKRAR